MDRVNKIYRLVGEELAENHLNKDQVIHLKETHRLLYEETEGGLH